MRDRIKYIAAYQVAPASGVTHITQVQKIKPHGKGEKFEVVFTGPAQTIRKIVSKSKKHAPYGPIYAQQEDLLKAQFIEDVIATA